uniref:Uncharacterized protein n=1 Tax=Anguilla anguilla TaxID=7936 RepID=A0A0E9WDQ1_ANGAN
MTKKRLGLDVVEIENHTLQQQVTENAVTLKSYKANGTLNMEIQIKLRQEVAQLEDNNQNLVSSLEKNSQ